MVPTQLPLPLRQDVTFFKRAHRMSTLYFLVYWEKSTLSQVSIIVPKHQLKTSVKRHRVKRQIRGAWLRLNHLLNKPARLVFVVNRVAENMSVAELEAVLKTCFEKINTA